jgi:hypothetical protein
MVSKLHRSAFVLCIGTAFLSEPIQAASTFKAERTTRHGNWGASSFRNLNTDQIFCAAETKDGETYFRINRYKESGDTFLELYNSKWTMMPGAVRFKIAFNTKSGDYNAEFRGQSWGDSYTHDFTDVKNYELVLGILIQSSTFQISNSNGAPLAKFSANGATDALRDYVDCLKN